jgi:Flp pilus assembly protein TadD
MTDKKALERVGFISIAETTQRRIGEFTLDPDILLPIELPPGELSFNLKELQWEAIIAGTLKVLAYDAENTHADYYRRFVLAVKPEIREELTHLGITSSRNANYDLAEEVFKALEGLFPDDGISKMNLALVYDEYSRHLETRADTPGEDPQEGAHRLVEEYQGLAFEAYKRALAVNPSEPVIHYNLAFFYLHQRSFDKAREHLTEYLKLGADPKMVRESQRIIREIDSQGLMNGLFRKAYDFIRMNREEEGIAAIREFLESHPQVPNAWFILGWGLRRLARYAEGKEAFLKAISLGEPHADALNELAICLMELGELTESAARLREALRMEPENTKIISNLGIVSMKSGKNDEAKGFFRTVLEIEPEDAVARRYLGLIEEKNYSSF